MAERISVAIPNWNGRRHLSTCLTALRHQTVAPHEVILVDNGSTDDSVEFVRANFPEVKIVALPRNLGVAGGFNAGIRAASGDAIALLNNDTEADPGWIAALTQAMADYPQAGCLASKLRLFDRRNVLHSAGDFVGTDGIAGNRGVWQEDRGQFDDQREVFSACGGAGLYRRAMLDDVGLFDESLGSFLEDVDLGWRAQLAGYRCIFVPEAIVYHQLSATGGGVTASYYVGRNTLAVLVKDVPGIVWRRYGWQIVRGQLRLAADALRAWRGEAARARLRGMLAGVLAIPYYWRQRPAVQRRRRITDEALLSRLTPSG